MPLHAQLVNIHEVSCDVIEWYILITEELELNLNMGGIIFPCTSALRSGFKWGLDVYTRRDMCIKINLEQ